MTDEMRELFDDLFELPQLDLAPTITLPQPLTPDLSTSSTRSRPTTRTPATKRSPGSSTASTRPSRSPARPRDIYPRTLSARLAARRRRDHRVDRHSRILFNACLIQAAFIHTGLEVRRRPAPRGLTYRSRRVAFALA